jgi:hypothetical protein
MAAATKHGTLLFCDDASGPHWQLGSLPPPSGAFVLVGWTMEDAAGDVPPARVARAVARALARYGRATFPCSSVSADGPGDWRPWQDDLVSSVTLARGGIRLRDWVRPPQLPLRSTIRETSALGLFDDPFYQWWNQTQFTLVSHQNAPPPKVSDAAASLAELFTPRWATTISTMQRRGVDAILRPGVDGDVIGCICSSEQARREFEQSLELAAGDFELGCRLVREEEFESLLLTARDDSHG